MTIVNTEFFRGNLGNRKIVAGQSVLSGTTNTGDVTTGLNLVQAFFITVKGTAQQGSAVNETLPLSSGDVTAVVETNDSTFYWVAIGK